MSDSNRLIAFWRRKGVDMTWRVYGIDALSHMALGLFATLLVGTILNTVGSRLGIPFLTDTVWPLARSMTGAAIGVAVAQGLRAPALVLFASAAVGHAGNLDGGAMGALVATLAAVEIGKMVSKETALDIIVTPATVLLVGVTVGRFVGPPIGAFMAGLGGMVMYATTLQPFLMGMVVAVVVGIVLTLPISSAALCMMLSLGGLAGGAATAGCCAQMVGFAVMSFDENGWGGLAAQGLGTSMLQIPNIVRNPRIWIPPTVASLVAGPLATVVFRMENIPIGSGMGTCGLVGQIGTLTAMVGAPIWQVWGGMVVTHFLVPAIVSLALCRFLRRWGWIHPGDLKLPKV